MQYQTTPPRVKSKSAATGPWLYQNPPSRHFSSSASYGSPSQSTEVFQSPTFLPFVEAEEELFPLESAVHFHPQRVGTYSQPQAGPSSSYAVGSSSTALLPPISTYDDTPPLQPPVVPTTMPNPYNQPPPF